MSGLTGTGQLVRLVLRLDRLRIPLWLVALVGIVYASVGAVATTYATPAEIQGYAATMGSSPAAIAMAGPPVALDTLGGIVVNETQLTAFVGVALMAVFLTVRHTRAEEELGRTELLRSGVLGRHAPLAAALLVVSAAGVLVGLGVTASVLTLDVPREGAWLYGTAVALFGIAVAAVAAVTAQLASHARGAVGLALVVLAVSFVLRAVGDVQGSWVSWLSPLGWAQQVTAFGEPRWWPLALLLLMTVVGLAAAVGLANRRDVGSGVLSARPGPARAATSLSSPAGLAWRLQRGSVLGWSVGLFLGGAAFGSFSREVSAMVETNPELGEYFAQAGGADLVSSFLASALLVLNLIAPGFAVSSALRMRSEESAGRLEPVLATALSRSRWLAGNVLVTLAGTALVVAAAGLGIGLAHGLVTDDLAAVPRLVGQALVYLPAVLALAAVAVLLFGWLPRLASAAWAALGVVFVVGYLGPLLSLPSWLERVSPFTHTPLVPVEAVTAVPLLVMALCVVLAVGVAGVGFRRRDAG